ncbi:MAG: hypothetical protein EBS01_14250 [Verrucomicrobia bacterium]|nr:hypothetical protein [Verrucomicrobiota bacterium]
MLFLPNFIRLVPSQLGLFSGLSLSRLFIFYFSLKLLVDFLKFRDEGGISRSTDICCKGFLGMIRQGSYTVEDGRVAESDSIITVRKKLISLNFPPKYLPRLERN